MLVLSRKPDESIVMPEAGIVVTVLSVQGNRVRLGITAPADVTVFREELARGPQSTARKHESGVRSR